MNSVEFGEISFRSGEVVSNLFNDMIANTMVGDYDVCRGAWTAFNVNKKKPVFAKNIRTLFNRMNLAWYKGDYYTFNGKIWVIVDKRSISYAYQLFLEKIGMSNVGSMSDLYRNNVELLLQNFKVLEPRDDIMAFENGVLDCRDFSFHKFSPKYHVFDILPYPYKENAECRRWKAFLREVLPDKNSRRILQMFLGLGLVERSTVGEEGKGFNVELCLMLLGNGGNGKSTIHRVVCSIFGSKRISGLDYGDIVKTNDEGMRTRTKMRGAIFNWCTDSNDKNFGKKNVEIFKRVVSGEPILDRKIGENVEENRKMPYLIFNLNNLPEINSGIALIRRLQYINFTVTIPTWKQNPHLANDLEEERSGIFNWIVRGCKEVKRKRFVFPDSAGNRRMIIESLIENNPVLAWIKAYDIRRTAESLNETRSEYLIADLYEYFVAFMESNGYHDAIISRNIFCRQMLKNNFTRVRKENTFCFYLYGAAPELLGQEQIIDDMTYGDERDIYESDSFIEEED